MSTYFLRTSTHAATAPVIEQLEGRRLLSASIDGSSVLRIDGTSGNNRILVFTDPSDATKLDVKIDNGKIVAYRARVQVSFKYEG